MGVRIGLGADTWLSWWVLNGAIALALLNLHLYDKRVRWVIHGATWLGLMLQLAAGPETLLWAGRGFVLVSVSALALKEQFCFKIPGLRAVPALLAVGVVLGWLQVPRVSGACLALSGVVLAFLALAKWRMPLHFDVGDKSRYQV